MRRASGPEIGSSAYFIRKQTSNKNKSPNIIKAKSRGKIKNDPQNCNALIPRKTSSFSKTQQNQSSTFFTSNNNKSKKSVPGKKKQNCLKKYEKKIMQILHQSACIIQRQWRKYLIRKYKKQLRQRNIKIYHKNKEQIPQFDAVSVSGGNSQNSQLYNNKKYYSYQQLQPKKLNQSSSTKELFLFNLPRNKKILHQSPKKISRQHNQREIIACPDLRNHNRTKSDQPTVKYEKSSKLQKLDQKCLQINPKIISIVIQGNPDDKKAELGSIKSLQQHKYEDHYIQNQKNSLDQILSKIQKKLQQKKLKRILTLQNSFSNNLMTFRSYKKNIQSVSEEHNKILTILQHKKIKLIENLNQFAFLCQSNVQQLKKQDLDLESNIEQKSIKGQEKDNANLQLSMNLLDSSRLMTINDWDQEGSFLDKKNIQNNQNKVDIQNKFSKIEEEILIYDEQRQTTIINQLICQQKRQNIIESNKNIEEQKIQQKPIENIINQTIFTTPPKLIQTNQLPILNQNIKSSKNNQLIEVLPSKCQLNESKLNYKTQNQALQTKLISKQKSQSHIKIQNQQLQIQFFKNTKNLRSQKQVQQQLQKFYPIQPTIDIVNNWLLQISHFILDNFGGQFLTKLINIQQPNTLELFRCCKAKRQLNIQYIIINKKIFKQFEFYHIKTLQSQQKMDNDKKQIYSALMYTFNQALYDCLNRMLMDQLLQGKNWINYPWLKQFKVKKLIGHEYSKQTLQKAINRVSNISDYNIFCVQAINNSGRLFQHTQHNLIFAEQIKEISLNSQLEISYLIYNISVIIQQQIYKQEALALSIIFG